MFKKLITLFVMCTMIVVLPACFNNCSKDTTCCASHEHEALASSSFDEAVPGVLVVNVLDKDHFDNCHIKGSIHVPFEQAEEFAQKLANQYANKSSLEIIVYCSNYMCSASGEVAKTLHKKGFTNVKAYEGGVAEWYQNGLPTEGTCSVEGFTYLKKKMSAPQHSDPQEFAVITTQQLAQKLGVAPDADNLSVQEAVK